jgi:hypothetical protein
MCDAEVEESIKDLVFPKPSAQPAAKFVEILLNVAVCDAMVGLEEITFQVAGQDMNPPLSFIGYFGRCDLGNMVMLLGQRVDHSQGIGMGL